MVEPATSEDARPAAKQPGVQIALSKPLMIALIAVLVLAVLGAIVMRRPSRPEASPSPDLPPAAQAPIEAVTQPNAPGNSAAPVTAEPGPSKEAAPPPAVPDKRSVPEAQAGSARGSAQLTVAEARVCQRFSTAGSPDWRCEQVGSSVAPGSLVYYTRIRAATATTVEHRWYHGDDLQQRVRLEVAANPAPGYRTYSRLAVSAAGGWRVEVRTTGGSLLHQARFNVR
jgi:type IV secretory pathway VirB10-like protein